MIDRTLDTRMVVLVSITELIMSCMCLGLNPRNLHWANTCPLYQRVRIIALFGKVLVDALLVHFITLLERIYKTASVQYTISTSSWTALPSETSILVS